MNKIGIIICSASGADYETFDYPVETIHINLHLNDVLYKDFVDIKADEFYYRIKHEEDLDIKTSQPSVGEVLLKYKELKNKGYKDILVITISSKLSGTYQGCVLAAGMIEGVNIRVVDSKSVSYGEMYLLVEALKLIKEGKSLDEVADTIEAIIPKIDIYVYVDTLKFLVKNGRLSATKGALATLLKIKPDLGEVKLVQLTPVVGAHAGHGTLGVGFAYKD